MKSPENTIPNNTDYIDIENLRYSNNEIASNNSEEIYNDQASSTSRESTHDNLYLLQHDNTMNDYHSSCKQIDSLITIMTTNGSESSNQNLLHQFYFLSQVPRLNLMLTKHFHQTL